MTFTQKLSDLLIPPKEPRHGFPWIVFRLASPGLSALEILLAAVIVTGMMANNGLLSQETARAVAELAQDLDRLNLLPHPAEALAVVLLIHKGGNGLMSIIEKVLQPLLNAQRELGRAEGRAEGLTEVNSQWRLWLDRKTRAEAEGKPFNEPPPDSTV